MATNIRQSPELVPGQRAHLEGFDHVSLFDVVEIVEGHAALEACRHLTGVVLEPLQGVDAAGVAAGGVPDQAGAGAPDDLALGDVAPGDHGPRDAEGRPYLGGAEDELLLLGGEQTLERLADVVE